MRLRQRSPGRRKLAADRELGPVPGIGIAAICALVVASGVVSRAGITMPAPAGQLPPRITGDGEGCGVAGTNVPAGQDTAPAVPLTGGVTCTAATTVVPDAVA